jgi:hypothetical protein
VVHPTSNTLCTTAVEQVVALAAHYRALFRTPAVSSESEAVQRERSTATVYRLRQDPVDDDPALSAYFSLQEIEQALFHMADHKAPGGHGVAAQLLKYCGPHGKELLLLLCNLWPSRQRAPLASVQSPSQILQHCFDTRPRVHPTRLEGGNPSLGTKVRGSQ